MTPDRVERLREWASAAGGNGVGFVYTDGVRRLLDEREALLAALKGKHGRHADHCHAFPATSEEQIRRDCDCGLQATIRAAEAL